MGAVRAINKFGKAKQQESDAKCKDTYNNYLMNMQKINADKVKANQSEDYVIPLKDYCKEDK